MNRIQKYLFHPDKAIRVTKSILLDSRIGHLIPDKVYIEQMWKNEMGRTLDLDNPKTFNEKLQWLKLYDRKHEYTTMVDKYDVKKYVSNKIGEEYIIPTYGVYERFDDIDFESLPDQFVLKCTHDSGGLVICRDKSKLDLQAARKKISRALKVKYYYQGREWPYKNVKPRVIAEKLMVQSGSSGLRDYKFFCFDGEPKFLYISEGLENHAIASISFLNMDWTFAPYLRSDYKPFEKLPPKPATFDKMVSICKTLTKDISFVRCDLYEVNAEVFFSELTFCPKSGFMPFVSYDFDIEIGEMLKLPNMS